MPSIRRHMAAMIPNLCNDLISASWIQCACSYVAFQSSGKFYSLDLVIYILKVTRVQHLLSHSSFALNTSVTIRSWGCHYFKHHLWRWAVPSHTRCVWGPTTPTILYTLPYTLRAWQFNWNQLGPAHLPSYIDKNITWSRAWMRKKWSL